MFFVRSAGGEALGDADSRLFALLERDPSAQRHTLTLPAPLECALSESGDSRHVAVGHLPGEHALLERSRQREVWELTVEAEMEVQIEIERAAESLRDDDGSRAAVRYTGTDRALAETVGQHAHDDAPDRSRILSS